MKYKLAPAVLSLLLLLSACGGQPAEAVLPPPLVPALARTAAALTGTFSGLAASLEELSLPEGGPDAEQEPESAQEPEPEPPVQAKFLPLLERNPYLAGWLRIDGTAIDDPVLYTPADQNFFLSRDFDGNPASAGTLFLGIPWREGNDSALIYGHNMRNGQRFGGLLKYAEAEYGLSHSVLEFDTLHGDHTYRLLGAFYSEIYEAAHIEDNSERQELDEDLGAWSSLQDLDLTAPYPDYDIYRQLKDIDDGNFRYYWYTDLSDRKDFEYYVEQVKAAALYDTGTEAVWGDRLLTLSTCAYHKENGRFVVVWVEKDAV